MIDTRGWSSIVHQVAIADGLAKVRKETGCQGKAVSAERTVEASFERIAEIVRRTPEYREAAAMFGLTVEPSAAEQPETLYERIMSRFKEPGVVPEIACHLVDAAGRLKMIHDGDVGDIQNALAALGTATMDTVGVASF